MARGGAGAEERKRGGEDGEHWVEQATSQRREGRDGRPAVGCATAAKREGLCKARPSHCTRWSAIMVH